MTPEVANGFSANFSHESNTRGAIDPAAHERGKSRGSGGIGEGQWTGARRRDFENYGRRTGQNIQDHNTNVNYLLQDIGKGYEGKMFDWHIADSSSPQAATRNVMKYYERPGAPMLQQRLGHSHEIARIADAGNPFGDNWRQPDLQPSTANMLADATVPLPPSRPESLNQQADVPLPPSRPYTPDIQLAATTPPAMSTTPLTEVNLASVQDPMAVGMDMGAVQPMSPMAPVNSSLPDLFSGAIGGDGMQAPIGGGFNFAGVFQ